MKLNQLFVFGLISVTVSYAHALSLGHLDYKAAERVIHNENVQEKVSRWINNQPEEQRLLYQFLNHQIEMTMNETLMQYQHRSQYNAVCRMWQSIPEIRPLIRLHTEGSTQRKNAWNNALWTNKDCAMFML